MKHKNVEALLTAARKKYEVTDSELAEARERRDRIAKVLRDLFVGSRIYVNGSVAHGDALTPLTDIDLGVVVLNPGHVYGPDGLGPRRLMDLAADRLRRELRPLYPKLRVVIEGQHHAILIGFGDPVTPGQRDFTADVIIAIDNTFGSGLFIPNIEGGADEWEASDPEEHTRMVLAAIAATEVLFAHAVRLLKVWSRSHSKPLCSWNLKALALPSVTSRTPQLDALRLWFDYAIESLSKGPTPDPAGVSGPIEPNLPINEVLSRLRSAKQWLAAAAEHEAAGRPVHAQRELAKLFPDAVPAPSVADIGSEEAARLRSAARSGLAASAANVALPWSRSWAPD